MSKAEEPKSSKEAERAARPVWERPTLGEMELREVESLAEVDLAYVMSSGSSDAH